MKKIRKSLSQIPQKILGAFGADFTITSSDVFMTFAAVLKIYVLCSQPVVGPNKRYISAPTQSWFRMCFAAAR